ncbi:hypothetical protein NX059_007287 [Plenodomus lindquistii]|nr:hypothetical protein NX059_007287 [Plenodomus lindquistii]
MATAAPSSMSQARLIIIISGLWICLFLSAIDTTIVTTALIKISGDFNALDKSAWLVTAYLLTYNSFLMITAKLSDIWGLKITMLSCAVIFLVASMACGGAQTMVQLIVFRAFQGIGGSGLYSLTFVSIMKLISPEKIAFYSGIISSVFAMANLLGPLFGGIISDRTTWRWIFFLNGPILVVAMILLVLSMPTLKDAKSNRERVRGLDGTGGILSVCWPIPLIFALQDAGVTHPWSSGVIIGTLVTGIVLLIAFGCYETWVTYHTAKDAIFPMHFLKNPSMRLILLSQFLMGMPFYAIFVQLPQRFQSVNFTTAERAGILLLPISLISPLGAMASGVLAKKMPLEFVLVAAIAMVFIGTGLLSSLPTSSHIWPGIYGYEVITGLGLGLSAPPYFMLIATSVEQKDISVATGALNMFRTLGGCIAVAICSTVHQGRLNTGLPQFLSSQDVAAAKRSGEFVVHLPEDTRHIVGVIFGESYNRQFQVMLAFNGLNVVVIIALCILRKQLGIFGKLPDKQEDNEFVNSGVKPEGNQTTEIAGPGNEDMSELPTFKENFDDGIDRPPQNHKTQTIL